MVPIPWERFGMRPGGRADEPSSDRPTEVEWPHWDR